MLFGDKLLNLYLNLETIKKYIFYIVRNNTVKSKFFGPCMWLLFC